MIFSFALQSWIRRLNTGTKTIRDLIPPPLQTLVPAHSKLIFLYLNAWLGIAVSAVTTTWMNIYDNVQCFGMEIGLSTIIVCNLPLRMIA